MGEPHASTGLPCTDKYHLILNDVMWSEEGNIRIQAQCVDLSIKHIPTQTNTRQSNSCFGPGPGVGDTGSCSRSTSAFAATNSSQLILSVILFRELFKVVGLDIPANVKTFVGIWHFVCQLVRTFVNKAIALRDVCQGWRHTIIPSECTTH